MTPEEMRQLHDQKWELQDREYGAYRPYAYRYKAWKEKTDGKGGASGWPARYDWNTWHKILEAVEKYELVAHIENTEFGFNVDMWIHKPAVALFPGVPLEHELVLGVSHHHIPHKFRPSFKEAWAAFEPVCRTPEMVERAKRDGWKIHPMDRYDY